jgi:hypothetical protein
VLDVRENRFLKTLFYLLKHSFGFNLCKPNTWYLNCNNFYFNFNIIVLYASMCCVCVFSLHQESLDMILGDKSLISELVLS